MEDMGHLSGCRCARPGRCARWGRVGLLVTLRPGEEEPASQTSGDGLGTLQVHLKGL